MVTKRLTIIDCAMLVWKFFNLNFRKCSTTWTVSMPPTKTSHFGTSKKPWSLHYHPESISGRQFSAKSTYCTVELGNDLSRSLFYIPNMRNDDIPVPLHLHGHISAQTRTEPGPSVFKVPYHAATSSNKMRSHIFSNTQFHNFNPKKI